MLVQNWMTPNPITVTPQDSMSLAAALMRDHRIRILPVLKKDQLVGVVTDRDIKKASASSASTLEVRELNYLIDRIRVAEIMTPRPITVPWDHSLDEAAQVMNEHKISSLPVVDHEGRLVGVLTQSDVCRALVTLTGLPNRGIQFGLRLPNRPGAIKDASDLIRRYGGRVASILGHDEKVLSDHRLVYLRMYGIDRERLPQLLEELRKQAQVLYLIDYRTNKREVFDV
jgi:acetoin utilization protein AcuB